MKSRVPALGRLARVVASSVGVGPACRLVAVSRAYSRAVVFARFSVVVMVRITGCVYLGLFLGGQAKDLRVRFVYSRNACPFLLGVAVFVPNGGRGGAAVFGLGRLFPDAIALDELLVSFKLGRFVLEVFERVKARGADDVAVFVRVVFEVKYGFPARLLLVDVFVGEVDGAQERTAVGLEQLVGFVSGCYGKDGLAYKMVAALDVGDVQEGGGNVGLVVAGGGDVGGGDIRAHNEERGAKVFFVGTGFVAVAVVLTDRK